MKIINNNINDAEVQRLIALLEDSPKKLEHLQVFLHREKVTDSRPDNYFLMVSPRVFGIVEVLDLKVEGDYIDIQFMDCTMQEHGNIRININDEKPNVLFICWQDIRKMVIDENHTISNDELLELDIE